jgi:hypothetical protein
MGRSEMSGADSLEGSEGPNGIPGIQEINACETDTAIRPGPAPIRRLTREEYNATVRDLLGTTARPADTFPAEPEVLGFSNNAGMINTTDLHTELYLKAAESLATAANLAQLLPCTATTAACGTQFIQSFGPKAFRRPLLAEENTRYVALLNRSITAYGFDTAIRMVLQAFLQSPYFFYRVETGEAGPDGLFKVTPFELASRLSYLLWGSMPDSTLLTAAGSGKLATADDVKREAARMLTDAKAKRAVASFHRQYFKLDALNSVTKDPNVYPQYAGVKSALATESARFLEYVFFEGDSKSTTLFSAPFTFVNPTLATFYGVESQVNMSNTAFQKVNMPVAERAGILTHAGILAAHSLPNQSSPIHRGVFIREDILCQDLPPPPNDLVITPPDLSPTLTTRERFAEHTANAACAGCHSLIDPIGFGLENFDGIGRYRATENGKAIDSAGEIGSAGDANGPYSGGVELAQKLSRSEVVNRCLVLNWFRFANGRKETDQDVCTLYRVEKSFVQSGYDMKELVVALTQSDAFLYRPGVTP